jgi:hypothetical protein
VARTGCASSPNLFDSASSAAPIIERSVQETINASVIPKFTQATQHLIETLSREMRQEILAVRKDIVSEQSLLLTDLMEDVRLLKQALQAGSLPSHSPQYSEPRAPPPQQQPQYTNHVSQQHQQQNQVPPPRTTTPLESYEDVLLKMLSEPDAAARLAQYVAEAPSHRAPQIFLGYNGKAAITQVRAIAFGRHV